MKLEQDGTGFKGTVFCAKLNAEIEIEAEGREWNFAL